MKIFFRVSYRFANFLRRIYWFVFRPSTREAKCLIEHGGKTLIVKNTYGSKTWTIPGGGVRRGEDPKEAVIREVKEEVGITLSSVEYLGSYFSDKQYKRDTIYCFYAKGPSQFEIDGREIEEAKWIETGQLPNLESPVIDKILPLWLSGT